MRFSLKKKVVLFTVTVIVAISFLSLMLFYSTLTRVEEERYTDQSIDLARTVALSIDADLVTSVKSAVSAIYDKAGEIVTSDERGTPEYEAYISQFSGVEEMGDFRLLLGELKAIQDVNHVRGLYIVYLDAPTESLVYLADASPEDVCPPGCADLLVGEDLAIIDNPAVGFDPSVTNTEEYGWNIATAKPIYDDNGEILAYACVDISMNEVVDQRHRTLAFIAAILLVLAAIVSVMASALAGRVIVRPINALSEASLKYRSDEGDSSFRAFGGLDIHTGDEIEILAQSMKDMEDEIRSYSNRINKMALGDSLTGVRNRRAYDAEIDRAEDEIAQGIAEVGLIIIDLNDLKVINDRYGHEHGDAALKKLCGIICQVFDHSPVFRIGGDEFAVVLKGRDYQNAEDLLRQFYEILDAGRNDESLEPWERIVAAAGFSVFDPGMDKDMSTVFARVDEAMYKRKREQKAEASSAQA